MRFFFWRIDLVLQTRQNGQDFQRAFPASSTPMPASRSGTANFIPHRLWNIPQGLQKTRKPVTYRWL